MFWYVKVKWWLSLIQKFSTLFCCSVIALWPILYHISLGNFGSCILNFLSRSIIWKISCIFLYSHSKPMSSESPQWTATRTFSQIAWSFEFYETQKCKVSFWSFLLQLGSLWLLLVSFYSAVCSSLSHSGGWIRLRHCILWSSGSLTYAHFLLLLW